MKKIDIPLENVATYKIIDRNRNIVAIRKKAYACSNLCIANARHVKNGATSNYLEVTRGLRGGIALIFQLNISTISISIGRTIRWSNH